MTGDGKLTRFALRLDLFLVGDDNYRLRVTLNREKLVLNLTVHASQLRLNLSLFSLLLFKLLRVHLHFHFFKFLVHDVGWNIFCLLLDFFDFRF